MCIQIHLFVIQLHSWKIHRPSIFWNKIHCIIDNLNDKLSVNERSAAVELLSPDLMVVESFPQDLTGKSIRTQISWSCFRTSVAVFMFLWLMKFSIHHSWRKRMYTTKYTDLKCMCHSSIKYKIFLNTKVLKLKIRVVNSNRHSWKNAISNTGKSSKAIDFVYIKLTYVLKFKPMTFNPPPETTYYSKI